MSILAKLSEFLKNIFDVRDGRETEERIIKNIQNNVEFRGASLWTLIFAILIASIGLNTNSIAIIIGAMLISPLMGPIVGFGLSLGINDSVFLRKSFTNLSIATVISIIISTVYFYLSPISNVQSELLARTSPTIYDILIAFFGGIAGIVGSTRVEKGNVIPGVAIATALMPPLCTVGYGIATGQPHFFLGAFYLYAINCIFICLATLIGVKYLRLPPVEYVDRETAIKTRRILAAIVVIMVVPAIYLGYVFVQQNNFNENVDRYIQSNFISKGHAIIYKNTDYKSTPHTIELAFLSKHFDDAEISRLEGDLANYRLENTQLVIKQDRASLTEDEWNTAIANIKNESEKIKVIEAKLSSGFISSDATTQILAEAQTINSRVVKIAIGNLSFAHMEQPATSTPLIEGENMLVVILYSSLEMGPFSNEEKKVLTAWINTRMNNKDMTVLFH